MPALFQERWHRRVNGKLVARTCCLGPRLFLAENRQTADLKKRGLRIDRALPTVKEYLATVEYKESRAAWLGEACGGMERVECP
jgi:hypothetical protein